MLTLVGAYVCVLGLFVHRLVTDAGGIEVPWGLALTVGTTYAVAFAAEARANVGAAWIGLGWALTLMAQQFPPGGGYLLSSDWLGWSFTAGSLGAIVLAVVRPSRVGAWR